MPYALITQLTKVAAEIRRLESDARSAMDANGDEATYRANYRRKCEILQDLPRLVGQNLGDLPEEPEEIVEDVVADAVSQAEDLARRAGQALSLDSVFYMYALLYPEEYQEGQPNELERFIARLEKKLSAAS